MKMSKEEYLLQVLSEECNEVSQRISKAFRFGLEEIQTSNPNETQTNRERIIYEVNDLITVIKMLMYFDNKAYKDLLKTSVQKELKLNKYMEYSLKLGIIN